MSKPGRRIVIKTVRKDVSRIVGVRPGLGIHPHADRYPHRGGKPDQRPVQSSLPGMGADWFIALAQVPEPEGPRDISGAAEVGLVGPQPIELRPGSDSLGPQS
jgi:hypothetical protein